MNESGFSVQKIVHFYKLPLDRFYLVHDDLDLPVGNIAFNSIADRPDITVSNRLSNILALKLSTASASVLATTRSDPVEDYVLRPFTAEEKV